MGMLIKHDNSVDMNVIERKLINDLFFPITSDKNISTCVNAVQAHQQLQAIFTASILPPSNQLSVEIILKNVDDCSSPAWAWFVESECRPGIYTECSSTQMARVADFAHCVVTCYCLHSCKFLYLKYNRLSWQTQTSEQLCEVWTQRKGRKWPRSGDLYVRFVYWLNNAKHFCRSIIRISPIFGVLIVSWYLNHE